MSRLAEALGNLFLLDARTRRALDETTADWRLEAAGARGSFGRVWSHLGGIVAVARVITSGSIRGAAGWATLRSLTTALLVAALGAFAATTLTGGSRFGGAAPFLSVSLFFVWLPLALVGASGRALARGALPSFAGASFLVLMVVGGWGVPFANQAFRQKVFDSYGGQTFPSMMSPNRGLNEMTLVELMSAETPSHSTRTPGHVINQRLVIAVSGPVLLFVWAHWRARSSRLLRALQGVALAAGYFALIAFRDDANVAVATPWIVLTLLLGVSLIRSRPEAA